MKPIIFELARQVALQSDFTKVHVGCVITYKGMPVSTGFNTNKTHPMQDIYNKFRRTPETKEFKAKCHAEISALLKIKDKNYNPKKLCVYVYRITRKKSFGMARPCPSCMQAIKDFGIKKVCYTTNTGYAEEVIDNGNL